MSYAKYYFFAIRLEMLFHLSVTVFTRKGQQDTVQKADVFISLLSQLILHKEYTFTLLQLQETSSLPIFIGYSSRIPNVDKSLDKRKHLFYDLRKLFKVRMFELRTKVHLTNRMQVYVLITNMHYHRTAKLIINIYHITISNLCDLL